MKPSQPRGAVESRVWYAHNLVVQEQHESKVGETAVAAAARQALESTKSLPRSKVRSSNRARLLVGMSLAGAAVAAVSLPWRQEAAEPQLAITRDPSASAIADGREIPATGDGAVQKVSAQGIDQTVVAASQAAVKAPDEEPSGAEPRVAGFAATDTASITTGTAAPAGSVQASPFALAPAPPGAGVGEIVPSSSAPEIEVVELKEGEAPLADDDETNKTTSSARVRKRSSAAKQSVEYYETGDCAMPSWAWRVFGFTEPVKKRRGCGG